MQIITRKEAKLAGIKKYFTGKPCSRNHVCERFIKASKHRRRAREALAPGKHTSQDIRDIYNRQEGKCVYCKKLLGDRYQVDHIVPLSKGGSNYPSNLQITCDTIDGHLSCNQKKMCRDHIEFSKSIGLHI
jgi:5-methylcytosine-specific restriction endonuclease McrA